MKTIPCFIPISLAGVWLAGATAPGAATQSAAAEASTSPAWEVAERGQDFAVYQRVVTVPQADGSVTRRVLGQFTLLENGLHYRDPDTPAPGSQPGPDRVLPGRGHCAVRPDPRDLQSRREHRERV